MDYPRPHGSTDQLQITRQCTATSKRSGQQCRKPAMKGRTVCLAHGGKTPRGIASPHFRDGRYSRSIPGQLLSTYEAALQDPRLLSLRDEIALTDSMIGGLIKQLDDEPNPAKDRRVWGQIGKQMDLRRRLVESEVRHMVIAEQMIPVEQVMTLLGAVVEIVKRYVPDPDDRHRVAEEITNLIDQTDTTGGPR